MIWYILYIYMYLSLSYVILSLVALVSYPYFSCLSRGRHGTQYGKSNVKVPSEGNPTQFIIRIHIYSTNEHRKGELLASIHLEILNF
jgi:hypothetical protein